MSLARSLLLRASRSRWLERQARDRAVTRRALRRFMPGEELDDALAAARELAGAELGTVFTCLGERVATVAEGERVRDHYLRVLDEIEARALPTHISVKLTHLGLDVDRAACARHVLALAARAEGAGSMLWLDMEESYFVDATLAIYRETRAAHARVGVCLQAYLHRTPDDLDALLPIAPAVRLVKGAYREPRDVALASRREVDARYVELADRLLAHVPDGAFPVLGTHDLRIVGTVRRRAAALALPREALEVHMLYGIRAADQRALAASGCVVRTLVSYGSAWWAWYMRRLAEKPGENVWMVLRNI